MTDLKDSLEAVAAADRVSTTRTDDDLARAHRALARAKLRRGAITAGIAGVSAAAFVGWNLVSPDRAIDHDAGHQRAVSTAGSGIKLLAETIDTKYFTFDVTPEGWTVESQRPQSVTISPTDGSVDPNPDVFVGKLVILYDRNQPAGADLLYDGRTFFSRGDSGYTTLATETRASEPDGEVLVQFPDDAGWSQPTMLQFLDSVHVNDNAKPGFG